MTDALLRALHDDLPITRHLGIRVASASLESVALVAPLAPNRNHRGTAFAGSVNALATLAGWSWLWLFIRAERLAAQAVIQDSAIRYTRPIGSDFTATTAVPSAAAIARLLAALGKSGRGRIALEVSVADDSGPAAQFSGRYVLERAGAAPPESSPGRRS